ncbi:hypothetical protein FOPE_10929 [Fonsecaea pedrosoi]|nr:hypothetical protein FOPE_10929 [Fonsecaea pedrosoi]
MAIDRSALVVTAYTAYNKLHRSVDRTGRINEPVTTFKKINMSADAVNNMRVYDITYFISKGNLDVLINGDSVKYIPIETR